MKDSLEPNQCPYFLKIMHKFDFSSELQRMSTIVKSSYSEDCMLFVKGSPEMIERLSLPQSLPSNYVEEYNRHTSKGHRVIAMGYKLFPNFDKNDIDSLVREDVEKDIIFLGLLIMVNELKPPTKKAISDLKNGIFNLMTFKIGGVVSIMATGDNILTGINKSVGCGILENEKCIIASYDHQNKIITWSEKVNENSEDSNQEEDEEDLEDPESDEEMKKSITEKYYDKDDMLAYLMESGDNKIQVGMEGTCFQQLIYLSEDNEFINNYPAEEVLTEVLRRGKVFARMSPKQKALLVEELQKQTGEMVGMCGDGAND